MSRIGNKFKYIFSSNDLSIPRAQRVAPFVLTIAAIASVFGIVTTITSLKWNKSDLTTKTNLPPLNSPSKQTSLKPVLDRNLFNVSGAIPDAEGNSSSCTTEAFRSDLPYKINGILYGGSSETSLVVLDGGLDSVFKQGDALPQGGVITSIERGRILVKNKACPEFIEMEKITPLDGRRKSSQATGNSYKENGFERSGNTVTASKQWLNGVLTNNFAKTLEEAKASPNIVNGQIKGFSISNITPESVYAKMGLQENDVVLSINRVELNDAARAIQTLNAMRNENSIEVTVLRGGQTLNLKVNIQ